MKQLDPHAVAAARRARDEAVVLLDGAVGFAESWPRLVSIGARIVAPGGDPFATIDGIVGARRARGGPGGTGVLALVAYEPNGSDTVIVEVNASVVVPHGAEVDASRFGSHGAPAHVEAVDSRWADRAREACEECTDATPLDPPVSSPPLAPPPSAPPSPPPAARTSLPREAYLRGVDRVKRHIVCGDIYQANLTQRFTVASAVDPFELYRGLTVATPAPRAAFVQTAGFALASASPEVFVDAEPGGRIATFPIKGTRRRGAGPDDDRRAAEALLASEKDRAELMMIVDLMRNDLGRVCRTGSIRVPERATLRSFPALHHLVARVDGDLRSEVGPAELLAAVFPGGSITGAPKIRAMQLLRAIEPVPRGAYTGSLFWFGDDGATRSSILIRSIVVRGREASIGAGGGIVADSDPESEWRESNDKARALTRVLGFEPEEAV